jgi:glycosyltransferase involved in cell wall biosynthesis
VVNEPIRRWRVTGTDLLPAFAAVARVDMFGIAGEELGRHLGLPDRVVHAGDLPPHQLHAALATRRAYLHPVRWTSLGLALLEAMHLGMPVLALATTEVMRAVPPEAGAISTDVNELVRAARELMQDPAEARRRGSVAREVVLQRYGLKRFLSDWDQVLEDAVAEFRRRHRPFAG